MLYEISDAQALLIRDALDVIAPEDEDAEGERQELLALFACCCACGRPEWACSSEPCAAVIADRES